MPKNEFQCNKSSDRLYVTKNNNLGIAVFSLIVGLSALAVISGGVYYAVSQDSSDNGNTNTEIDFSSEIKQEQKEVFDQVQEEGTDITEAIDALDNITDNEYSDMSKDELRAELESLRSKAQYLFDMDICKPDFLDVMEATILAEKAFKLNQDRLGRKLVDWAKEAFQYYVADKYMCLGPTIDVVDPNYWEKTGNRAEVEESIDKLWMRGGYALNSITLGFEDIHDEILAGQFLEPKCYRLWDVKAEASYRYDDGYGYVQNWDSNAVIKEVPFYRWSQGLGLPFVRGEFEQEGSITKNEFTSPDVSARIIPGRIRKNITWNVSYRDETNSDFWLSKIFVKMYANLNRYDIWVDYDDGNVQDVMGWDMFEEDNAILEVPLWKFYCNKEFSVEKEHEGYGKGTLRVTFMPGREVQYDELKQMVGN